MSHCGTDVQTLFAFGYDMARALTRKTTYTLQKHDFVAVEQIAKQPKRGRVDIIQPPRYFEENAWQCFSR